MLNILLEASKGFAIVIGVTVGLTSLVAGLTYAAVALMAATAAWVGVLLFLGAVFAVCVFIVWMER